MEGSGQLVGSVARGAVDSSAKQRAGHVRGAGVECWGGVRLVCGVCEGMYFILSWVKLGAGQWQALHVVQCDHSSISLSPLA